MRFSVPRSLSPSPVRKERSPRKSGTFRAPSVSSDSEEDGDDCANSDSSGDTPEPEVLPLSVSSSRKEKSAEETSYIADAIASIRLAVSHRDPYEEWTNQTRREARQTARLERSQLTGEQRAKFEAARARDAERLTQIHQRMKQEIEERLAVMLSKRQTYKQNIDNNAQARAKKTRDRIEAVIQFEEDRQKEILEKQRLAKEAEERKAQEEEKQKQLALLKQREEKLKQDILKAKEDAEKQKREQEEKEKSEKEATQASLGLSTPSDDWATARNLLKRVKAGPLAKVKANREVRIRWSRIRREITPKIGQLTNDNQVIQRVCKELLTLCHPSNFAGDQDLYMAVIYSLSKAILLQAEVEVTAEKRSAAPLARVASFFVQNLDRFPQIFFMKLVQRTGGWPIPVKPPPEEGVEYSKLAGFREDEALPEYTSRVAGLMRVYFQILVTPTNQPTNIFFRPTMYWTYFARLMRDRSLLASGPVGPELLATALNVGGVQAREIFGKQWHKLMELLYSGLTEANSEKPIGGKSPEGTAARTRALLEVEEIMNS